MAKNNREKLESELSELTAKLGEAKKKIGTDADEFIAKIRYANACMYYEENIDDINKELSSLFNAEEIKNIRINALQSFLNPEAVKKS